MPSQQSPSTGWVAKSSTLVEKDVEIRTVDGVCDAVFLHPPVGRYPGVILWADSAGLRPVMRALGRRLAEKGYAVLMPNPFYRVAKTPSFEADVDLAFNNSFGSTYAQAAMVVDAFALINFLDSQPAVNRKLKFGTHGYGAGGALAVRTAAALGKRIGACASFHGSGLVTDRPDAPYLLSGRVKAPMLFAIARSDDDKEPDAKEKLQHSFAAAQVPVTLEVFPQESGWCLSDKPAYDEADAERAWSALLALYERTLV
ncbi:MAG TPA: dienelactone hydrolase family protein [Burkholderiaceae bacterium]